ncbi:MAG: EamA family transporter [Patescibacteria group bacterium]|nr:EamA family transporter [Patescibacteria group bacterium]
MNWILITILGHLSNGVAFAIDKMLLRSAFTRSATYAGLVGLLSSLILVAVPFVKIWPSGLDFWLLSLVTGATFIFALWAFFGALARAEATRIVPIVGSLIPIFTLIGSFAFLAERLSDKNFLGFGILIVATIILSSGKAGKPSVQAIWLSVGSAMLFAISSVAGKAVYGDAGFFGGFVATRLFAAFSALFVLILLDREAGREALSIFIKRKDGGTSKHKQPGATAAILALVGQSLGALGFVLVQYGISRGSPSIVNAMQAVQYAFLVLLALLLRHKAPQLLGENLTKKALLLKVTALVITAFGLFLIV